MKWLLEPTMVSDNRLWALTVLYPVWVQIHICQPKNEFKEKQVSLTFLQAQRLKVDPHFWTYLFLGEKS